MKKLLALAFLSFVLFGCGHSPATIPDECTVVQDAKHKVSVIVCSESTPIRDKK